MKNENSLHTPRKYSARQLLLIGLMLFGMMLAGKLFRKKSA